MTGRDATADRWASGAAYEAYVGRWSRLVAAEFLAWLEVPAGRRWLDVGCGTGVLTQAILARADPAAVVGVDPSEPFVDHARAATRDGRARFVVGSAGATTLDDGSVDAVVSGLVLNFVPDVGAALAEARRVATPGATIGAYVWDYAAGMALIRRFWDAAAELDPAARSLDEGVRFPIAAPDPLDRAFRAAGLTAIAVRPIDVPTDFADFDELWRPFINGTGPAPAYVAALDDPARDALRDRLRTSIEAGPDGSIRLPARAWAVRGTHER